MFIWHLLTSISHKNLIDWDKFHDWILAVALSYAMELDRTNEKFDAAIKPGTTAAVHNRSTASSCVPYRLVYQTLWAPIGNSYMCSKVDVSISMHERALCVSLKLTALQIWYYESWRAGASRTHIASSWISRQHLIQRPQDTIRFRPVILRSRAQLYMTSAWCYIQDYVYVYHFGEVSEDSRDQRKFTSERAPVVCTWLLKNNSHPFWPLP